MKVIVNQSEFKEGVIGKADIYEDLDAVLTLLDEIIK